MASNSNISVYVRVRPLLATELSGNLPGLVLSSTSPEQVQAVALESSSPIGGFNGVLGQESDNRTVFERSFASRVATVLRGGSASLFCYGYTGSGKTHTVVGYNGELGMYHLAASSLLQQLREAGHSNLFLRATSCEVYGDRVLDLLGPEKLECTLYVGEAGQLEIRGPSTNTTVWGEETGLLDDPECLVPEAAATLIAYSHGMQGHTHATLITRSCGLQAISVHDPSDLAKIGQTCLQQRVTGSSTTHHQSSRSHAILRMEVTNDEVMAAREALSDARSSIPARKNAVDNLKTMAFGLLFEPLDSSESVLLDGDWTFEKCWEYDSSQQIWRIDTISKDPASGERLYALNGMDGNLRTISDWAQLLDAPKLHESPLLVKRYADQPGKWEAEQQNIRTVYALVAKQIQDAEARVDAASTMLESILESSPRAIGGSLLLVDLAGADYDHRSGSEQKESAAINKSLLALKECFRALGKVSGQRPKFRDSKLTRLLEDSLAPSETTQRRNRESVSVLIVNVSPAADLERMTLNTLRYGQMFAGDIGSARSREHTSKLAVKPYPNKVTTKLEQTNKMSAVRAEVLRVYEEHCPEKSAMDVKTILSKFAGRENELLAMARQKYVAKNASNRFREQVSPRNQIACRS